LLNDVIPWDTAALASASDVQCSGFVWTLYYLLLLFVIENQFI